MKQFKRCSRCKLDIPLAEFGSNRANEDGKHHYCKPCAADINNAWKRANKEKVAATNKRLKKGKAYHVRKFGLTPEQYDDMVAAQMNLCFICGREEPNDRRLCVDHCHTCDANRALLCTKCNTTLGRIEEDGMLEKLLAYLEAHHCDQ